jgi:glycine cleavage system H lipoate-binding protein
MILDGPGATDGGRCATAEYGGCGLIAKDCVKQARCPHFEEVRVQYCGAFALTKLVPFSESQLPSCTSESFHYCDSYLLMARPHATSRSAHLLYSPNHFWLDASESGLCHIGLDGFLADVIGAADGITFVTSHGTHAPTVTLNVYGIEWPMSFPNQMTIQKVNSRLHSDPSRLTSDPYGVGWLFEGRELPDQTRKCLIAGEQAAAWQAEERERLSHQIHETHALNADGGIPVRGVAQLLPRQDLVSLLQHFFSRTGWTDEGR